MGLAPAQPGPFQADWEGNRANRRNSMATKGKKDLIISKSRTKEAVRKCNVAGEFYSALDKRVREMISMAETRALANKRKTVKSSDV